MIHDLKEVVARTVAVFLALALVSCSGQSPTEPPAVVPPVSRTILLAGLEGTVTITPSILSKGATVSIVSSITNVSDKPVTVVSRICGLDLETNLDVRFPEGARCGGYSVEAPLLPRSILIERDSRIVASPAGRYYLRVRHAVNPSVWVELPVEVR